jgi:hypothetical protein
MMRLGFSRNAPAAFLFALGCGLGLRYFLVRHDAAGWLRRSQHRPAGLSNLFLNNDSEPHPIEVLGATRDFLHVKYPARAKSSPGITRFRDACTRPLHIS